MGFLHAWCGGDGTLWGSQDILTRVDELDMSTSSGQQGTWACPPPRGSARRVPPALSARCQLCTPTTPSVQPACPSECGNRKMSTDVTTSVQEESRGPHGVWGDFNGRHAGVWGPPEPSAPRAAGPLTPPGCDDGTRAAPAGSRPATRRRRAHYSSNTPQDLPLPWGQATGTGQQALVQVPVRPPYALWGCSVDAAQQHRCLSRHHRTTPWPGRGEKGHCYSVPSLPQDNLNIL